MLHGRFPYFYRRWHAPITTASTYLRWVAQLHRECSSLADVMRHWHMLNHLWRQAGHGTLRRHPTAMRALRAAIACVNSRM